MNRQKLKNGLEICGNTGKYTIISCLSDSGGTSLTYRAYYQKNDGRPYPVVIKEFYPDKNDKVELLRDENGCRLVASGPDDNIREFLSKLSTAFNNENNNSIAANIIGNKKGECHSIYAPSYCSVDNDIFYDSRFTGTASHYLLCDISGFETLGDIIRRKNCTEIQENQVFSTSDALWYAFHIAEALEHFQNAGYLHLDIKPDNILLSTERNTPGEAMLLQIIDYGSAWKESEIENATLTFSSNDYSAKEITTIADIYSTQSADVDNIVRFKKRISYPADQFSVCSILLILLGCGKKDFSGLSADIGNIKRKDNSERKEVITEILAAYQVESYLIPPITEFLEKGFRYTASGTITRFDSHKAMKEELRTLIEICRLEGFHPAVIEANALKNKEVIANSIHASGDVSEFLYPDAEIIE